MKNEKLLIASILLLCIVFSPKNGKSQNVDTLVNAIEHLSEYFLNRHQDTNYIWQL